MCQPLSRKVLLRTGRSALLTIVTQRLEGRGLSRWWRLVLTGPKIVPFQCLRSSPTRFARTDLLFGPAYPSRYKQSELNRSFWPSHGPRTHTFVPLAVPNLSQSQVKTLRSLKESLNQLQSAHLQETHKLASSIRVVISTA